MKPCDDEIADECVCPCTVVPYNGLKGQGHPENLGWMYWPDCASDEDVQEIKIKFDADAGRLYKGARR